MALSAVEVAAYARQNGFTGNNIALMTAIAKAESSFNPSAHNKNEKTGDDSWGLWQINMIGKLGPDRRRKLHLANDAELTNPYTNARAAKLVYDEQGPAGWSTYKNGAYRKHLSEAKEASAKVQSMTPEELSKVTDKAPEIADKEAINEEAGKGISVDIPDVIPDVGSAIKDGLSKFGIVFLAVALLSIGVVLLVMSSKTGKRAVKTAASVAPVGKLVK